MLGHSDNVWTVYLLCVAWLSAYVSECVNIIHADGANSLPICFVQFKWLKHRKVLKNWCVSIVHFGSLLRQLVATCQAYHLFILYKLWQTVLMSLHAFRSYCCKLMLKPCALPVSVRKIASCLIQFTNIMLTMLLTGVGHCIEWLMIIF